MNKEINYSFIIPHKNCPDLLQRCVDSIPERDDIEIIIVDNNSSDEVVDFNHFPGCERKCVKVVRDIKSIGGGGARNTGLQKASGKWVSFIDCDDFFNYCINKILDDYKDSHESVVYFKTNSVDSDTYVNSDRGVSINNAIDNFQKGKNVGENYLRFGLFNPWGKIINRSFLVENKIRFDDVIVMNDVEFSYKLGYYAKQIAVDKRAMICITDCSNSVSKNHSAEAYLSRIRTKTIASKFYKENGIPLKYLKWNNYLFLSKYISSYPARWKEGVDVLFENGESWFDVILGLFIHVPLLRLKSVLKK